MNKFNYLKSANAEYIDELFARYSQDPDSVDASWRYFFEGIELGVETAVPADAPHAITNASSTTDLSAEARVGELIQAYRWHGRLLAGIDPLSAPPASHPILELSAFGLSATDLDRVFQAGKLVGLGATKLSDIIARLKTIYCGPVAIEYQHVQDPTERKWLQERIEGSAMQPALDAETRRFILKRLTESETFERFLHTRYVAQKRFSVEGGESIIPALDCMIEVGAEAGAAEFVMGMAHRGRLNVLTHIFGKKPEHILTEFEGAYKPDLSLGEGDVKYHMGHSSDLVTRGGKNVHLSLASNPSHLEFVNAVVEGVARAKQYYRGDRRTEVVPVQIHGDAAFAGQGVCYEVLNLSQLAGYGTGGSIHYVINNQVGFTTSANQGRSTTYCTDVAKMLDAPIFHVNGDAPESVWLVSKIAIEYRQKFGKDVFIDLVCYRKHGHNEGDEPSFTQPMLYQKIKTHRSTREIYALQLAAAGVVSEAEAQALVDEVTAKMTEAQTRTRAEAPRPYVSALEGRWKGLKRASDEDIFKPVKTAVARETLLELATKITQMPAGFHVHPKLNRLLDGRRKAFEAGKGIDWGNAECMAYATLVHEGNPVRLSGQDVERGTFTHRHAVLNDFETGEVYSPLNEVRASGARFMVHNSHLSETAVMGFEYGYSLADPTALVIWEAQFGDFGNGAQVIIDQFLASSESKWQRLSALVLLLPHGFEGQGPEHSSARLERFLNLCGRNNMAVCNLTTPAQIFHGLRRQMKRDFRKPLVVMSPKSLLRHPMAVSTLDELSNGGFQEVLDDPAFAGNGTQAKRVILCSGKVYYELVAERATRGLKDVAVVRVEQLYPWPEARLAEVLKSYPNAKDLVWVQEEPRNMGAWGYVFNLWNGALGSPFIRKAGDRPVRYVGRDIGAAPAVGSKKISDQEQASLIVTALTEK